jgi:hypothetical protein
MDMDMEVYPITHEELERELANDGRFVAEQRIMFTFHMKHPGIKVLDSRRKVDPFVKTILRLR